MSVLKQIADELLSDQAKDNRLSAAAADLYSLCSSLSGIDQHSDHVDDSDWTRLRSGEAISPNDAARCVLDYSRTSKFLRGLHAAIVETRKRLPNDTIEILYAGCGPFAPLAIPLTTRFNPGEIKFTLVDVHKRSLDAARTIFHALGKSAFVRDYIQCDAASYKNDHVIHIVVVEAMQAALEREPQVAITMNLAPQLCPGGIFLPERITINCYLCDLAKEYPGDADSADSLSRIGSSRVRINLGRVFELSGGSERGETFLTPNFVNVSEDVDGEFYLMLTTTITIFDSIALNDYESGLTCPRILYEAGKMHRGESIEFKYQLGDKPGFRYRSYYKNDFSDNAS